MKHVRKDLGITLIELMITIAILAILASIAIPSFNNVIRSDRITKKSNELYATVMLMRAQAIRANKDVTICVSANAPGNSATLSCDSGSNTFSNGAIVFYDMGTSGQFDASTDELIDYFRPAQGLSIYGLTDTVTLTGRGLLKSNSAYFVVCDDDVQSSAGKIVEIRKLGRPSIEPLQSGSCTS